LDALLQKQKAERSPSWSDILSLSKQVDAWKQLIFLYLHERSRLMGKEKKKKKLERWSKTDVLLSALTSLMEVLMKRHGFERANIRTWSTKSCDQPTEP
jgi:hypothetical protein